ncbi:MAG: hypothetical protein QG670_2315 [Thermoproteota archaeon]|nr:hypothetical protein [Thermoproteota archaeon]
MRIAYKPNGITSPKIFSKIISFQVFFLKNDKDQSVKVVETNRIDFDEVEKHLKIGESIYILPKKQDFERTD